MPTSFFLDSNVVIYGFSGREREKQRKVVSPFAHRAGERTATYRVRQRLRRAA